MTLLKNKGDIRLIVSGIAELLGICAIVAGFSLIAPFLGLIVGGFCLILLGLAVDPPARKGDRQ